MRPKRASNRLRTKTIWKATGPISGHVYIVARCERDAHRVARRVFTTNYALEREIAFAA